MSEFDNKGGIFTSVLKKREKRSTFDLSHDVKLSLDMGLCVPVFLLDTIPGDKISINSSTMLRMAPLVSPVMHRINVYLEYFFVPNRILWGNWETFITGSRNGKQLPDDEMPAFPLVRPYQNANFLMDNGSLADYLGLPTENSFDPLEVPSNLIPVSLLPFAAYQRIWDEYYRDENLIESVYDVEDWENYNQLFDGTQTDEINQQLSNIRPRAWEHDYFTSALPFAQKGEEVTIPIDLGTDVSNNINNVSKMYSYIDYNKEAAPEQPLKAGTTTGFGGNYIQATWTDQTTGAIIDNSGSLFNQSTINDLRAAIKLQEWLETNARGGSRYFESIYAHFGVKSPDSRLQRPEFIGSSRSNMVISEVLQTSSPQAETDTPQGNMSGHGQAVDSSKTFTHYSQEHGHIIGIMSVMPKTAYQQGIPRMFSKTIDKLQYYYPEFAHLGEQEILNLEIYAGGDVDTAIGTFGYTPRYSEYKFLNSRVAGDFRDTLAFWHMGRIFDNAPMLNDFFISSNPTKRIFAVQDLPQDSESPSTEGIRDYHSLYAHVFHDVKANRLMPKYGTPTL